MEIVKVFVVEDDQLYAKITKHHLSLNPDNEVEVFASGKECLHNLYKAPHLIFLDYSLPDISGIDVLRKIKQSQPELPVIIVSGQEDISTVVSLLKEGAYDYIVKDNNVKERMWKAVNNIRENTRLRHELDILRQEVTLKYDFSNIKGNSNSLQRVFKLMEKAASTNITVSITGETGTGKELVAKAIHYNSTQKNKSLINVNIAAIPHELIESELFGHEKGAFTGAINRRIGRFEEAKEGTIFLDEIAELDLSLQAKLLRVLQEKEITRVGGNTVIKTSPRVIVATHKNLAEEVKAGRFREDLYYRLLGLPIELPPLRQRGNDILLLAKYFLDQFCAENKISKKVLSTPAQNKLLDYTWPGNVRELKAVVELAAVLSEKSEIAPTDINFNSTRNDLTSLLREGNTLKDYSRKIIQYYLDENHRNVVEVAQMLDIGKSTIYRMIKNKELEV